MAGQVQQVTLLSSISWPGDVKAEVGEGSAAQLLLDAAWGASLVVVGSRAMDAIAGTLLGSVGQSLAQHSPCPVLIIRASSKDAAQPVRPRRERP